MDYFDIQTTAELRQELKIKVEQAEIFCLLLSPTAVEMPWVNQEMQTAQLGSGSSSCFLCCREEDHSALASLSLRSVPLPHTLYDLQKGLVRGGQPAGGWRFRRGQCGQAESDSTRAVGGGRPRSIRKYASTCGTGAAESGGKTGA
jgi:hypothetical protein